MLALDKGAGGRVLLAFSGVPGDPYEGIRRSVVALTLGERDRETAAVACPVFGLGQQLEGALSLSGPLQRFTPTAIKRMSTALVAAAGQLTAELGGDVDIYKNAQGAKGNRR